ncbi:MAG TPA: hypothetical protein VHA11_03170 [Bryobacteraceae bacterium]|nr:hypothetical protein [Bryobacteraceae bacterium]
MTKRFILALVCAASLAIASAKTYKVTLFQPTVLSGTELKPGNYKLNVENDKVVITDGKQSAETTVKVEQGATKFQSTTVRYAADAGKNRVQEICLGGTTIKLVFNN